MDFGVSVRSGLHTLPQDQCFEAPLSEAVAATAVHLNWRALGLLPRGVQASLGGGLQIGSDFAEG